MEYSKKRTAVIYTLFSLLVFTPSIIIVIILMITNAKSANPPILPESTAQISASDIGLQENTQIPLGEKYMMLIDKSVFVKELPPVFLNAPYMEYINGNDTYRFYFSDVNNEAYYIKNDIECYRIDENVLKNFYSSGDSVDSKAVIPVMREGGAVIYPTKSNFSYITSGGSSIKIEAPVNTPTEEMNSLDTTVLINFDIAPTTCTVFLYNGDNIVFSGTPQALSNISLSDYKSLHCRVEAVWLGSANSISGQATYIFKIIFTEGTADNEAIPEENPPVVSKYEFSIDNENVAMGDFTVLHINNVADIENLSLSFTPSLSYVPSLYKYGENKYFALIAIPCDAEPATYLVNINYRGATETIKLHVSQRLYKERVYNASSTLTAIARSQAALTEYENIKKVILDAPDSMFESDESINNYKNTIYNDSNIFLGFGYYRILPDGTKYRMDGVDYKLAEGVDITAIATGKVEHCGYSQYLGNYIVVDHGAGVRSWYAHLGTISVDNGITVNAGETIGISGKTGFTMTSGVYLMCTVNNVFVSPYKIIESGILKQSDNVNYEDIIYG